MTRRAVVSAIILLCAGIALCLLALKRPENAVETRPFVYGQEEVLRFLKGKGIFVEAVDKVARNASGDALLIYLFGADTNSFEALQLSSNELKRIALPGPRVFALTNDHFGAWLTKNGHGVEFRDGSLIELPPFATFDLDASGKYFVVGEKPSRTWIGRASSPNDQQLVVGDVLGSRVFIKNERIYVCGTTRAGAVCLVVTDDGGSFRVRERHTFDWASGIVDVDPAANRLLLWNNSDLFTTVYVYDLETKRRSRVGGVKGFEFFLRHDLLARK
jgi:hypothetical protein